MKTWVFIFLTILIASGCQARPHMVRPVLETEGAVYLYLQPLPQEADPLRFSVVDVSAVREDGAEYPLSLSLSRLKGTEVRRQRLFASGPLPPGHYLGFALKVSDAFLMGEEGEGALLTREGPTRLDFSFRVASRKAQVLYLALRYRESVTDSFRFIPAFSVFVPEKALTGLLGFVTNTSSNTVTVFDKNRKQVVGVIPTGEGPVGMALDPKRGRLYVALSGADSLEVIDVLSQDIVNRIRLNTGDAPRDLALALDGKLLLSVNGESNSVSIIDPFSFFELNRLIVGDGPQSLLLDRAGRMGYVFNTISNTISVLDIPNQSVVATIHTEPGPYRGQFNQGGDRLYVIGAVTPFLAVFDPLTRSLVSKELVGMGAVGIKVDTMTGLIYLAREGEEDIEIYDPTVLFQTDTVPLKGGGGYLSIDGEGNHLYVVRPGKNSIAVVDLVSRKVLTEMDVGGEPYHLILSGERP